MPEDFFELLDPDVQITTEERIAALLLDSEIGIDESLATDLSRKIFQIVRQELEKVEVLA